MFLEWGKEQRNPWEEVFEPLFPEWGKEQRNPWEEVFGLLERLGSPDGDGDGDWKGQRRPQGWLTTVADRWSLEPSSQGAFLASLDGGCWVHLEQNHGPSTRDRRSS